MAAIGIRCYGKVQGVFFRASTKSVAEDIGVTGWVRNEMDGSVLIHAEGHDEKLNELVEWCRQGSEFSRVSEVRTWDEPEEGCDIFEIKRG